MIAKVEHDGVIGQPGILQLLQHLARLGVHLSQPVVVLRPVAADLRSIRMVGRDPHALRIMDGVMGSLSNAAFVSDGKVEDREERLVRCAVLPVSLAT